MKQVDDDLREITETIADARNKLHLRNVLFNELTRTLRHPVAEVDRALREFFVRSGPSCAVH